MELNNTNLQQIWDVETAVHEEIRRRGYTGPVKMPHLTLEIDQSPRTHPSYCVMVVDRFFAAEPVFFATGRGVTAEDAFQRCMDRLSSGIAEFLNMYFPLPVVA